MTCEDYLSMLETLPVQELGYGEARDHAAYCAECSRVTRVVAARERNMTLAYESAYPSASAVTVAERAIAAARRQRIAFFYRAGLALSAVAVIAAFVLTRRVFPADAVSVRERHILQCLSGAQAGELIRHQVSNGDAINLRVPPGGLAVIEVGGSAEQVRQANRVIERFDNPQVTSCAAEIVVPTLGRVSREVPAVAPVRAAPVLAPATAAPAAARAKSVAPPR